MNGGSSGMGFETARLLVDEGALVTVCGRDLARLRATEADLDSPYLHTHQADVYDSAQAHSAVTAAAEHGRGLDAIAAIAGRGRQGSVAALTTSEVVAEVSNKLLALFNIVEPALQHLTRS